jgi:hypothetical protein
MKLNDIRTDRQATIDRAVELLDTAERADVLQWLAKADVHDHLKIDPPALRDALTGCNDPIFKYGWAWMIARQILQAAGLPH